MTLVWIAQGVDFSTPCRQRLISFKPLTRGQKYKTLGSSTLLCKAAFGVPVFFGVQNIHRLKALKLRIFPLGFQLGHPHRKTCGQSFMTDICGANVLTTHRKTCGQSFMADICGANVLTLLFPKPFRYSPNLLFCMNRTGKILSFFPVLY